jgi:HEAT repeat protein
VRHAAASSLGQLGAREAVPALIAALKQEPWLQYPAMQALGEIGDPRAGPALVPLLDDALLRLPALEALARVAGRDALPRIAPLAARRGAGRAKPGDPGDRGGGAARHRPRARASTPTCRPR